MSNSKVANKGKISTSAQTGCQFGSIWLVDSSHRCPSSACWPKLWRHLDQCFLGGVQNSCWVPFDPLHGPSWVLHCPLLEHEYPRPAAWGLEGLQKERRFLWYHLIFTIKKVFRNSLTVHSDLCWLLLPGSCWCGFPSFLAAARNMAHCFCAEEGKAWWGWSPYCCPETCSCLEEPPDRPGPAWHH